MTGFGSRRVWAEALLIVDAALGSDASAVDLETANALLAPSPFLHHQSPTSPLLPPTIGCGPGPPTSALFASSFRPMGGPDPLVRCTKVLSGLEEALRRWTGQGGVGGARLASKWASDTPVCFDMVDCAFDPKTVWVKTLFSQDAEIGRLQTENAVLRQQLSMQPALQAFQAVERTQQELRTLCKEALEQRDSIASLVMVEPLALCSSAVSSTTCYRFGRRTEQSHVLASLRQAFADGGFSVRTEAAIAELLQLGVPKAVSLLLNDARLWTLSRHCFRQTSASEIGDIQWLHRAAQRLEGLLRTIASVQRRVSNAKEIRLRLDIERHRNSMELSLRLRGYGATGTHSQTCRGCGTSAGNGYSARTCAGACASTKSLSSAAMSRTLGIPSLSSFGPTPSVTTPRLSAGMHASSERFDGYSPHAPGGFAAAVGAPPSTSRSYSRSLFAQDWVTGRAVGVEP